jgi:hypothetical protein
MIYCSYELLYMFRALICPSSGAWDYTSSNVRCVVSSSWWWAYECPKHVEQFIRAIKHQVTSSWFFLLHIYRRCTDNHISNLVTYKQYLEQPIVIPGIYVVDGSETGHVSRDNVSRERIAHKRDVKVGKVPGNLFIQEEIYLNLRKNKKK